MISPYRKSCRDGVPRNTQSHVEGKDEYSWIIFFSNSVLYHFFSRSPPNILQELCNLWYNFFSPKNAETNWFYSPFAINICHALNPYTIMGARSELKTSNFVRMAIKSQDRLCLSPTTTCMHWLEWNGRELSMWELPRGYLPDHRSLAQETSGPTSSSFRLELPFLRNLLVEWKIFLVLVSFEPRPVTCKPGTIPQL